MKLYADLGNSRRKATFAFGFEDNQRNQNDSAAKAVVAQKNLYEYTKISQANMPEWRQDQLTKNHVSNIQWGLKAEKGNVRGRSYGSKKDSMS